MQVIIEIPESEIPKRQDIIEIPLHFIDGKVCEAGGYGFDVLPKGHGKIIDVNEAMNYIDDYAFGFFSFDDVPAVIEADEESEK